LIGVLKVLVGRLVVGWVGSWVGLKVTHFKFIGEDVDGEESTFNLNI
jgi:hypothetical protein